MRIDRVKLIAEMARKEIKTLELARKAEVSRMTISAVRSGKSCTKKSADRIAKALGVPVESLLEDGKKE